MNNIKCQNLVISFKIRMKHKISLSINHIIRGNTVFSIFDNLKLPNMLNSSFVTDVFLGFFWKFSEQLSFFKELLVNASLFYYTDSFSCPFNKWGFMCAKIFTEPKETEKKHLLICTDSSVPQIQADQLNETNYHLAFRVSSKGLCVESTQSKVFFEIAVLHLFGKLFEAHLRQSTFQQSCYLMLATMLNNFTLCQKFSKELPESVKYSCCNKHHWRRKTWTSKNKQNNSKGADSLCLNYAHSHICFCISWKSTKSISWCPRVVTRTNENILAVQDRCGAWDHF